MAFPAPVSTSTTQPWQLRLRECHGRTGCGKGGCKNWGTKMPIAVRQGSLNTKEKPHLGNLKNVTNRTCTLSTAVCAQPWKGSFPWFHPRWRTVNSQWLLREGETLSPRMSPLIGYIIPGPKCMYIRAKLHVLSRFCVYVCVCAHAHVTMLIIEV